MVRAYSTLVWICFFFSLALTIFSFYIVFSKSSLIQCYDTDLKEISCGEVFSSGRKITFVISNVLGLLIQLYICIVIRRYVEQLEDEQAYKNDFGLNKRQTSYYPFQSVEGSRGLLDDKK